MKRLLLPVVLGILGVQAMAQLRLPAVLCSNMVLQQNDSVMLWGWGYNLQNVQIHTSWNATTTSTRVSNQGHWKTKLKTPAAGGPYLLTISSGGVVLTLDNVMIGEVWLCSGQSNMEWNYYNNPKTVGAELTNARNPAIRFFQVPRTASAWPQDDVKGAWTVCDSNTLKQFSAVGYFFGKTLHQQLGVPIGLINASWGGTPTEVWTPAEEIYNNSMLKAAAEKLREVPWCPVTPGLLYNGMVHPISNYNIAGAIWYQGEGNTANAETYHLGFSTLLAQWRKAWKKIFPMYYVQIAPFAYGRPFEGAIVREQQQLAAALPKVGMVVVADLIDSLTDIHPGNKKDVGLRLANYALAKTYGKNVGAYQSPTLEGATLTGKTVTIVVAQAPQGLVQRGPSLTGFLICGADGIWLPASGTIKGNNIVLWNDAVPMPTHVRYCFSNTGVGNVFSAEGLPLAPFRTDNWPIVLQ